MWGHPPLPPGPSLSGPPRKGEQGVAEIDHDGKRTLIVMGRRDARSHCGVTRNAPPTLPPSDECGPKTVTRNAPPSPPSLLAISAEKDGNCGWSTPGSDSSCLARCSSCGGAALPRRYVSRGGERGVSMFSRHPPGGHRYTSRAAPAEPEVVKDYAAPLREKDGRAYSSRGT
jgi:hypothetical protein